VAIVPGVKWLTIELAAGVHAAVVALEQRQSYAGLLEGVPTREINARALDTLRASGVHVVRAVEKPLPMRRRFPLGEPSALPHVRCVATLHRVEDGEPTFARDGRFCWFQDEWALPIDEKALADFRAVDWFAHSTRYEL